ncbi:MAG: hypothetical protein ACPHN2_08925 [Sinimarinibacterium flocculans]|uniref:hypothetical protein n=1 Tax=Sinimarinibacterium flocculans TaxID=985250 RepID=UPI003C47CC1E
MSTTAPTQDVDPQCPYCGRPVTGPHHVDTTGSRWHLSCAEGLLAEVPHDETREADFWTDDHAALPTDSEG